MKTRTRKTTRVLCASAIAMMTLLSSAAPAFAVNAGPTEDTPKVQLGVKDNSITFDKKIYADEGENVPYVTIAYDLSPRTTITNEEKAAFAANGYDNVVAGKEGLTASATTFTNNSLVQGQNYFEETSRIDASSLLTGLTKPTVFTYTLKEDVPENAQGFITTDKGTTRKLNIYVGYKDDAAENAGTLSVLYATLAQEDGTKAVGFENNYDTQAIHLTKKVTGNQGDKTKKFKFTIKIKNQYSKVSIATDATDTNINDASLMPGNDHIAEFTADLKDGETININGLSKGATYSVTEDKGTYISGTTVDGKEAAVLTDHTISEDADAVVFTNTKEGKIPTGIYLNHKLPFNIAGIAILGGAISLVAKKRHDALEEDDDE